MEVICDHFLGFSSGLKYNLHAFKVQSNVMITIQVWLMHAKNKLVVMAPQ